MPEPAQRPSSSGSLSVYRRLLMQYGLPYWKQFVVSVIALTVFSALEPAIAALMKPLVDQSLIQGDIETIRRTPLNLLGVFLICGIASFYGEYYSGWVGRRVIADLRRAIFDQLLLLPSGFYDTASSGQLLAKLLYNTEQIAQAISEALISLVRDTLSIIGLLILMVYLNWELSLVLVIVGPILAIGIRFTTSRFRRLSKRIQESMGNIGHVAQEAIDAERIVKVFGGMDYEREKFAAENEEAFRRRMRMIATDSISKPLIQLIYAGGFAALIYTVSVESIREAITVGTFFSFVAAMAMLLRPIKRLMQINVMLQQGIAAGSSIFELLDIRPELDTGTRELDQVQGHIEYRGVSLRYRQDDRHALRNVHVSAAAGRTIALVGQSGSGKTSLVRLLPRLYELDAGQILIDGVDIRQLKLANLRKHIAYVGQEVTLFNDTVANNIAYGCRDAVSPEAIRAAAQAAHALEFIERLPNGFDTQVGQHGIVLSGGQRQRIAIARALLKNAPILILDEATSALDAESECRVQEALEELMRNRTTLVIAHRLATIKNADWIYVMRDGEVIEQGTHEDLLGMDAAYSELYRLQTLQLQAA